MYKKVFCRGPKFLYFFQNRCFVLLWSIILALFAPGPLGLFLYPKYYINLTAINHIAFLGLCLLLASVRIYHTFSLTKARKTCVVAQCWHASQLRICEFKSFFRNALCWSDNVLDPKQKDIWSGWSTASWRRYLRRKSSLNKANGHNY